MNTLFLDLTYKVADQTDRLGPKSSSTVVEYSSRRNPPSRSSRRFIRHSTFHNHLPNKPPIISWEYTTPPYTFAPRSYIGQRL